MTHTTPNMDMDYEIESIDNQSEEVAVAHLDEARKRDFLVVPRRLSIANVFRLLPCLFYNETSPC